MEIMKFGGNALKDPEAFQRAANIAVSSDVQRMVVVSAMGGITDQIITAVKSASSKDLSACDKAANDFRIRHFHVIELLKDEDDKNELRRMIEEYTRELVTLCEGVSIVGEYSQKTLDLCVSRGERASARIFTSLLVSMEVDARYADATDLLIVRKKHNIFIPCTEAIAKNLDLLDWEGADIFVVPGFIARSQEGHLVCLGRGGSDYSATMLGGVAEADKVTLYKDVDGLLTADPRYVSSPRVIERLHYREAAELAYYGAKVLHPSTITPLVDHKIPLLIKNVLKPDQSGTEIGPYFSEDDFPVKALTAITSQSLISIQGKGMSGVPGIAARVFSALASDEISVTFISQASSEASICFVVASEQASRARDKLLDAFEVEVHFNQIDHIEIGGQIAVVAVVGLGMKGRPGLAARVFNSLGRKNINIEAIAQGSSELNISMVVGQGDMKESLELLHDEFRLDKLRPLSDTQHNQVDVIIYGLGSIGRELVSQLSAQITFIKNKYGVDLSIVGLVDSKAAIENCGGFSEEELNTLVSKKSSGMNLREAFETFGDTAHMTVTEDTASVLSATYEKGIFVDLTASDTLDVVERAVSEGFHVVMANKKPVSSDFDRFQALFEKAKANNLFIRYEATVGAGLPILDTLEKLISSGDEIISVEGCLSGTLGYLMNELESGKKFSEAVESAHKNGFTEPHPRDDLSGVDVARKAVILARNTGSKVELSDIAIEALFRVEMDSADPSEFMKKLEGMDEELQNKNQDAAKKGCTLRYVAEIKDGTVKVGLKEVAKDSPFGRLKGTDNQIVLRTKRYDSNPLIVTGPGAGIQVTAAGVLNDIVALAAGR